MTRGKVTRETDAMVFSSGKDRNIIVTVHPNGTFELRLKQERGSSLCSSTSGPCTASLPWAKANG